MSRLDIVAGWWHGLVSPGWRLLRVATAVNERVYVFADPVADDG